MRFALILLLTLASSAHAEGVPLNYDLQTNLPLAHVMRDGPVADAGSVGFVKYLRDIRGRWTLGAKYQGVQGAMTPGLQANLWLPGGGDLPSSALALEVRFFPLGKGQRVDVFLNGKKIAHKVLKSGWQTHRVNVPEGLVKAADNHIRLHFRKTVTHKGKRTAALLRYARLTTQAALPAPEEESKILAALRVSDPTGIVLPNGAGLDYFVVPPAGARLRGTAVSGSVEVWVQVSGSAPKRLGGGSALDIDLKSGGQPVRLILRGQGDARLQGARIVSSKASPRPSFERPKHVIFWLIDTLRADKLGFYQRKNANGRAKVKTPNLDALVKEGTVFQNFWVQGNESKASHASLFTGTYPAVHKVYNHKAKLRDSHTTLAEAFAKAGYLSGGYVSNGYISDRWNFAQGFKRAFFSNFIRENKANNARAVTKAAVRFVDKFKARPFYLYLGTSDPHVTYRAHKGLIKKYDKGAYTGRYKKSLTGAELGKLKRRAPSKRDRVRIEALYENEIEFNDQYFGKLVAHLKSIGIYEQTMFIISADHGDEFWEHGSCGHGHNLHQELISVPLVIRLPKLFPAGKSAHFGVDGVDVLPTIQEVLGQPIAQDVQGASVLDRLWAQGEPYPAAQIASMGTRRYALQVGPAKVIMGSERSILVYDAANDAGEKTDIFRTKPIYARAALDPLSIFTSRAKRWKKREWGAPNNLSKGFQ